MSIKHHEHCPHYNAVAQWAAEMNGPIPNASCWICALIYRVMYEIRAEAFNVVVDYCLAAKEEMGHDFNDEHDPERLKWLLRNILDKLYDEAVLQEIVSNDLTHLLDAESK